jgi:hypothetical protein
MLSYRDRSPLEAASPGRYFIVPNDPGEAA